MSAQLVLLPGLDGTAELFAPFEAAIDGRATAQRAAYPRDRFLDYDQLEKRIRGLLPRDRAFLVVAESFSGPLGLRLAADPPPGMRGLVLVASFCSPPWPAPPHLTRALLAPVMGIHQPALALWPLLGPTPPASLIQRAQAAVASVAPRVMAQRVEAVLAQDHRAQAEALRLPTLYLQAMQDLVVPPWCGAELQRLHPALRLERLPGPHLLLQRQPRAAAERILAFSDAWDAL